MADYITDEDVMTWLKTVTPTAEHYTSGTGPTKPKTYTVTTVARTGQDIAIGGLDCTRTRTHGASILVHWTESTRETQNVAYELYNAMAQVGQTANIGGHAVDYIQMLDSEPVGMGADSDGVQEAVIRINIIHERS